MKLKNYLKVVYSRRVTLLNRNRENVCVNELSLKCKSETDSKTKYGMLQVPIWIAQKMNVLENKYKNYFLIRKKNSICKCVAI